MITATEKGTPLDRVAKYFTKRAGVNVVIIGGGMYGDEISFLIETVPPIEKTCSKAKIFDEIESEVKKILKENADKEAKEFSESEAGKEKEFQDKFSAFLIENKDRKLCQFIIAQVEIYNKFQKHE